MEDNVNKIVCLGYDIVYRNGGPRINHKYSLSIRRFILDKYIFDSNEIQCLETI